MQALAVGGWLVRCGLTLGCGGTDATSVTSLALEGAEPGTGVVASVASSHPITFTSDRSSPERPDIHLLALDGSVRQVTQGANAYHPRWSPSGEAIAFREQVENTYAEVGLVDPDGTEQVTLTSGERSIFGEFPVNWAPDETGIAFASRREAETTRIWIVPRDGGPGRYLFADDTTDRRELAWSTDGRRIAYADYDRAAASHSDGISKDIWVADAADPGGAVNLTLGRVHAPVNVQWSPDSRQVAFQAYALAADGAVEGIGSHEAAGPYVPPDYESFIIDVDTTALTRVTDDDADEQGLAWSPEGTHLLVASERDGDFDLWLVPFDDPSQARDLIDDNDEPYDDRMPDWFRGSR